MYNRLLILLLVHMASNKILKNFSYLGLVQLLNYALPIITIPLVSHALGVEKIGLINYIYSYLNYFILFVSYSFSWTAIRKQNQINDLNYTFSLVFFSQILLFVIAILLFFASLFFIPDLNKNLVLASISCMAVLGAFFDKNWVYQYKEDLSLVAIVNVVLKVISLIFIFMFVRQEKDYILYAFILYGTTVLINLILLLMSLKKYEIKMRLISVIHIISFLKEGKVLFFSSVVINLYTTTSILLLGLYCTDKDVGLYSAASKLIDVAKVFAIMPLTQLIYPVVAKKIKENVDEGVFFVKQLMPLFSLIALVLLIGSVVLGPLFIRILFGQEFLGAINMLWILSLNLVLVFFSTVFGVLLMVNLGMDNFFFKNQLFVAVLSVFLTLLILPYGAGQTSAIILVFSEFLITGYQYYCLKKAGYNLFTLDMFSKKKFLNALKVLREH
ncbi:oligosaccharide flippase family protein [Acinetobacter ursingii]|uniref:oligosaccharide flippase family protein n=1 Tax=Acinetobacter ursingii TaxID=108980 RepID=UPI003AF8EAB5